MEKINRIKHNCIIPSAVLTVKRQYIKHYVQLDKPPEVGDLIYSEVSYLSHHKTLESRLHTIYAKTQAVFAFGNRYAPDYYEGIIPDHSQKKLIYWLVGGLIGKVLLLKNALVGDPTQIRCLGYICDNDGKIINNNS